MNSKEIRVALKNQSNKRITLSDLDNSKEQEWNGKLTKIEYELDVKGEKKKYWLYKEVLDAQQIFFNTGIPINKGLRKRLEKEGYINQGVLRHLQDYEATRI